MDIKAGIGEYSLLQTGSIVVFNNEPIKLTFKEDESDPIYLIIKFGVDESEKSDIIQNVDGATMTIEMINFNTSNGVAGVFEPVEIAKADDGSLIFLSLLLQTFNSKDGNRLLTYSLLTRR